MKNNLFIIIQVQNIFSEINLNIVSLIIFSTFFLGIGFLIKLKIKENKRIAEEITRKEQEEIKRTKDKEFYKRVEERRITNLLKSQKAEEYRKKRELKEKEKVKKNLIEKEIRERKEIEKIQKVKKTIENRVKIVLEQKLFNDNTVNDQASNNQISNVFQKNNAPNTLKDQKVTFLNNALIKKVNYATYKILESFKTYPVIKKPKENSVIRSFRLEGNKRKGYKEEEFFMYIQDVFENSFFVFDKAMLAIQQGTLPYEPDIAMVYKSTKNIYIDIEIDEPYSGVDRKLTHCTPIDDSRDYFFTERGWIVIRFSEYQVHMQPWDCLYTIASIVSQIDPFYNIPNELKTNKSLIKEKCWDTIQAKYWERTNYRENYLNHIFTPYNEPYKPLNTALTEKELKEEKLVSSQSEPQVKKEIAAPIPTLKKTSISITKPIVKSNPKISSVNDYNYNEVKLLIDRAINEKKDVIIKYTNYEGETSLRRISEMKYTSEFIKNGYTYKEHFEGYCHKENETRSFKVIRINSIELIL